MFLNPGYVYTPRLSTRAKGDRTKDAPSILCYRRFVNCPFHFVRAVSSSAGGGFLCWGGVCRRRKNARGTGGARRGIDGGADALWAAGTAVWTEPYPALIVVVGGRQWITS